MDETEAQLILQRELVAYKSRPYDGLVSLVGRTEVLDRLSPSGTVYQVEIQVVWDDKPRGSIRVLGAIDDKGWRAISPLCSDFIILPDGSFVGE